jgi:hypothetical protein
MSKGDSAITMTYETESRALDEEILGVIERWHHGGEMLDDAAFNDLALRLFAYQLRYNKPYARYCERLGVTSPASWEEIPAVPAGAFKETAVTTFDPKDAALTFETSGTTRGTPGRHYMQTSTLYDAALLAAFDRFVLPDGAHLRYLNLVPNPRDYAHSSLGYMMARVSKERGDGQTGWYVYGDEALFDDLLRDIRATIGAGQAVCIAATAFALLHLLDAMNQQDLRLSLAPGSRVMETGGFKGRTRSLDREELNAALCERFGIAAKAVIAEYGMTELTSQYYATAPSGQYAGPPWLRARVVGADRKTLQKGEVGSLLHVDLANRSSCIAVQTEDLGVHYDDGFVLLGRAQDAPPRGCSLDAEELQRSDMPVTAAMTWLDGAT